MFDSSINLDTIMSTDAFWTNLVMNVDDQMFFQNGLNTSTNESEKEEEEQQSMNQSSVSTTNQLICGVCGAPAHGYNFDQVTCESCKAFFRRNALKNLSQMKCRFSGSCVINIQTRRLCAYCRLKKCFEIKMRKDWIRTAEERQLRRLQLLAKEQRRLQRHSPTSPR